MAMKLSLKQKRFVEEYLVDLNATQAAIRAGYSKRTADKIGSENLAKPEINAAIQHAMEERARRTQITADRVIAEMARVAFLDIGKAFNDDGSLKPIHEIDEDTRRAIAGLEVTTLTAEGAPIGHLSKIKLVDKLRALELLGKHLGMFNDKLTIAGDKENPLVLLLRQVQGTTIKPSLRVVEGREAA